MATSLVIGPPGTGKTTYCLNKVDEFLQKGYLPHQIAFLSFTKQAAREASERAISRFKMFDEKQFVWFRTLHSLAWRLNNMQWEQAFKDSDWRKFGAIMGLKFGTVLQKAMDGTLDAEDCQTEGDHLARIEQFARVLGITLEASYSKFCETDMPWERLVQYTTAYQQYKTHKGIYDYIDIINMCDSKLDVKLCIFDEAQDMTPQQFRMAERVAADVPNVLYAGDDMQAIFAWAGADVEHFVDVAEDKIVLPKSYRLPKEIFDVAHALEGRVERNYKREWTHNEAKRGAVRRVSSLASLPLRDGGDWLLIGRNWKTLDEHYVVHLRTNGFPYLYGRTSSLDAPQIQAVIDYETARKRIPITRDAAMRIFKYIDKKDMVDAHKDIYTIDELGIAGLGNWMEALTLITEFDREYIRALLRAGVKLRDKPRIRVDTIHGTKGGECDNVAILTDMSHKSFNSFQKNPDAEVRLFYTGVTRAKENLYIIEPQTPQHFII